MGKWEGQAKPHPPQNLTFNCVWSGLPLLSGFIHLQFKFTFPFVTATEAMLCLGSPAVKLLFFSIKRVIKSQSFAHVCRNYARFSLWNSIFVISRKIKCLLVSIKFKQSNKIQFLFTNVLYLIWKTFVHFWIFSELLDMWLLRNCFLLSERSVLLCCEFVWGLWVGGWWGLWQSLVIATTCLISVCE